MRASPAAGVLAATCLMAATTATWEMSSYADFLRGKLQGVALTRDGRLTLAPALEAVGQSDQPQIWSVARASDGTLYLGTGHKGRVIRVTQGNSSVLWSAPEPEVFAVAVDAAGVVYAGTAPDGKIYRIQNGQATEYFAPGAKYIWALAFGPDGALYAGAGEPGQVFRVTAAGQGAVYYDSGQSHITSLAFDRERRLLAGSEPNGLLYRIPAAGQAFVLLDANLPEIRTILPQPDGSVYVAALGGSLSRRAGAQGAISSSGRALVTAAPMSITVTDANAQNLPSPPKAEAPKAAPVTAVATAPVELTDVEKSAIYRIQPDHTVETLFSSKEENVYDLALSDGGLLFATDGAGRIYRLNPERKPTLLVQTNEGETNRLLVTPDAILAVSGSAGKLYRLSGQARQGEFESPVHDAGSVARWGRLHWRAERPAGSTVRFRTRSGNSSRPDHTWSEWSAPLDAQDPQVASPNARYLQWRLELASTGAPPVVSQVTAAYLPQNNAPVVRSVSASSAAAAGKASAASGAGSASTAAFSVTVTDTGEAPPAAGTSAQTVSRAAGAQIQIQWQADDPDGDKLSYSLYFRGEEEQEWKLLRGNMTENSLLLDGDVLADGRYYFRVRASDRPSNPVAFAKEAEGTSAPVLIDNTPPTIEGRVVKRENGRVELEFSASDATSLIRRAEYSLDAAMWQPVEAADGVSDSTRERYVVTLDLKPGEHLVVFRAYDAAGNAGLGKLVLRP
jgi:hypothetical protein